MKSMKAIVIKSYGGPSVLKYLTNWSVPKTQKNQVIVRVHSAGVNPVDTYIRSGRHNKPLPFVPGNDGAGVVEECGPGVSKFKKGDKVFFSRVSTGSYAQFCLVPEEKLSHLHNLSFKEGASMGIPYFTAFRALYSNAIVKQGQTVLVHGASGGVGLASVQLAVEAGANVLGTAGSEQGMKLVKENGASLVFNHRQPGYAQDIMKEGKIDVVLEMLADVNLQTDLDLIASGGYIVVIGSRGITEMTPRSLMSKECHLTGINLDSASVDDWIEMTSFMDGLIKKGAIKPVIGREFSMEEAAEAHEEVIRHTGGSHGKILLNIPQE